ncbi:MAG: hypothetical protein BAJATHORv1_100058 [Candidatus Thorarchaeota archaeon]|nr:MAG: hypothetical protein BAJATHORv1_100058 [Candidatus Thorarchaeota archaeon]
MTVNYADIEREIQDMIDRETKAWDTKDLSILMSLWHPDMVWPWPKNPSAHDPMDWSFEMGRFNYSRWRYIWKELFDSHRLVHNRRKTQKIEISKEGDGAFAVVDIDTLWIDSEGTKQHWLGRVCKVYTKTGNEWKIIMHTGVLDYALCKKKR